MLDQKYLLSYRDKVCQKAYGRKMEGHIYVHVNLQLAGLTVSGRPREKKCQQQYMEWKHFKYISLMADPPLISFSQSYGSCFHSIVWAGSHH